METLLDRIREKNTEYGGRIFAASLGTKDIVTIEGSVWGGHELLPREHQEIAVLYASLLDAGTTKRSKEEVRTSIAERGASLSFSISASRTSFSASCLPEDLDFMLDLIVECLGEPLLAKSELEKSRARKLNSIQQGSSNTRRQASIALERMLYTPTHPNYADSDAERIKGLTGVSLAEVKKFKKNIGNGGLIIAMAGDLKADAAIRAAERAFASLSPGTTEPPIYPRNMKAPKRAERRIEIPRKSSIDVRMGATLPFVYGDPAYIPTVLAADMLGGSGFVGHLMETVRDRDGLTYGAYAGLNGVSNLMDGYFQISASFAPELFERGVAAILKESKKFFPKGITDEGVRKKQEEFAGSYLIGLSTTSGISSRLNAIAERGQPLSYLLEHTDHIRAVSPKSVRDAAAAIPLDCLSIAAAGTFEKKAT